MSSGNDQVKYSPNSAKRKTEETLAVVGIGASAGGLEAFIQLLEKLSDDTGMAFVLIQHLEPSHESRLSEILTRHTNMPVHQVTQEIKIKKNTLYIIPPDKYLSISDGKLHLDKREKADGLYLPVDHFFKSLAVEKKNKAIGVILSGTASDGTEGLRAIKAEGGLTFAQDEKTAKYSGMPASAINSGNVDMVLSPEGISEELIRIGSHPFIAITTKNEQKIINPKEEDHLAQIFRKLRASTGVDFSNYKSSTIKRRITRRMVLNKTDKIEEYIKIIKDSKTEIYELYKDLLINVTNFYRDPEVFNILEHRIFPEIIKGKSRNEPIRIWVPGCSSGEEVFSIAISLLEYSGKNGDPGQVQIFATDISETAIEKARAGEYPESELKDIPPEIRRKYFSNYNGRFKVNKPVREICVFAKQDITKDPPFSRVDLISCRNLLIYFSNELQKKIIPVFHYALKPGGFLMLGTSESIGGFGDLFFLTDKKFKLYKKKQGNSPIDFNFSLPAAGHIVNRYNEITPGKMDIQKEADKVTIDRYAPPGILINSSMDIIQFRGKLNKYIEPSTGDASLNIFRMIKEGLSLDMHTAIMEVQKTGTPYSIENIKYDRKGNRGVVDLEVIPIKGLHETKDYAYLILFREREPESSVPGAGNGKEGSLKSVVTRQEKDKESEIDRLKSELIISREHLQSIIEEREGTNEELRSALEELQSSNEELQSTNEEMETTREELQSTNEELITVNDELESKNSELHEINNDLQNLLSIVNIPILMLDRDLKIRRYTPSAEKIWNLISGDLGRPIGNINPNIEVPNLNEMVLEVLDTIEPKEMQVRDNTDNWYSMKIRPYRTSENKIDGVIISLYDVDIMKREHDTAIEGRNFARDIFSHVEGMIIVLNTNFQLIDATKSFYEVFEINRETAAGKKLSALGNGILKNSGFTKKMEDMIRQNQEIVDFNLKINTGNGSSAEYVINTQTLRIPNKQGEYILMSITEGQ